MGEQYAGDGRVEASRNRTSHAAGNKHPTIDLDANVLQKHFGHGCAKVHQRTVLADGTTTASGNKGCQGRAHANPNIQGLAVLLYGINTVSRSRPLGNTQHAAHQEDQHRCQGKGEENIQIIALSYYLHGKEVLGLAGVKKPARALHKCVGDHRHHQADDHGEQ